MPEGGGADAERIVMSGTEQVLVDVLHRGAEHEGRAAVGMLELYHIRHAVDDIGADGGIDGQVFGFLRNFFKQGIQFVLFFEI